MPNRSQMDYRPVMAFYSMVRPGRLPKGHVNSLTCFDFHPHRETLSSSQICGIRDARLRKIASAAMPTHCEDGSGRTAEEERGRRAGSYRPEGRVPLVEGPIVDSRAINFGSRSRCLALCF